MAVITLNSFRMVFFQLLRCARYDYPAKVSSLTRNAETINSVLQVQKVNPPVFAVCGYVYKPLPWPGVCKQLSKNELRT